MPLSVVCKIIMVVIQLLVPCMHDLQSKYGELETEIKVVLDDCYTHYFVLLFLKFIFLHRHY